MIDLFGLRSDRGDTGVAFRPKAVYPLREHLAELGEERRIDKARGHGVQGAGLQLIAADVDAIVAGASVPCRGAAGQRRGDRRTAPAAACAFGETREEILRTPATLDRRHVGLAVLISCEPVASLAQFYDFPELVVQNTQFRHILDHPFFLGVRSCLAYAYVRILHEALTVPDDFVDMHLVVEDTVPALLVAFDRMKPQSPPEEAGMPSLLSAKAVVLADLPAA